jgi:hypothetical protein
LDCEEVYARVRNRQRVGLIELVNAVNERRIALRPNLT